MAKRKSKSKSRAKSPASPARQPVRKGGNANLVGKVLFLAGVILALLAGLVPNLDEFQWVLWVLVLLGGLVGLINISPGEQSSFLTAGIALLLVSVGVVAFLQGLGVYVANIFKNIIAFVAPTVFVVAVIQILNLARD